MHLWFFRVVRFLGFFRIRVAFLLIIHSGISASCSYANFDSQSLVDGSELFYS